MDIETIRTISIYSTAVTSIATIVIAWFAIINTKLSKTIKNLNISINNDNKKHQEDMKILQTNLIATLILTSNKNLQGNNLEVLVNEINQFELL